MLDAWEIRKRIAYAERRLRDRLAEANAARRKAKLLDAFGFGVAARSVERRQGMGRHAGGGRSLTGDA